MYNTMKIFVYLNLLQAQCGMTCSKAPDCFNFKFEGTTSTCFHGGLFWSSEEGDSETIYIDDQGVNYISIYLGCLRRSVIF